MDRSRCHTVEQTLCTGEWRATPFLYDTKWSLDQGAYPHWPIGLYDYGFRMYQPATGRFISRDPIREEGGLNLYQAFAGDPVNRTDFLGLSDEELESFYVWTEHIRTPVGSGCYEVTVLGHATGFPPNVIRSYRECLPTEGGDADFPNPGDGSGGSSGGVDEGDDPDEDDPEDGKRRERCDGIVNELKALSSAMATGVYRGTRWVNLDEGTRTTPARSYAADVVVAAGKGVQQEIWATVDTLLSASTPLYAIGSGYLSYRRAMDRDDVVGAGVALTGTATGTVHAADRVYRAHTGTSALSQGMKTALRGAGVVGIAYTAGSVVHAGVQNFERSTPSVETVRLSDEQRASRLEWLHKNISPRIENLSSAYEKNECADFY